MSDKVMYAMYDDDEVLKDGAKKLVANGVKISEVFSPFPVHGIDPIIGVKNTRLGIMAFINFFVPLVMVANKISSYVCTGTICTFFLYDY